MRRFSHLLAPCVLPALVAACGDEIAGIPDARDAARSTAAESSDFKGDPIVFVHGCPLPEGLGSVTNYRVSLDWRTMYETFRRRGYPAQEWSERDSIPTSSATNQTSSTPSPDSYLNVLVLSKESGNCGSNISHAKELANYVQQVLEATGAPRVDIIANSMGGLAARWYLKPVDPSLDPVRYPTFGGARYVRDFVMLASVNHGTEIAILAEPVVVEDESLEHLLSPNYDAAREASPAYNCDPLLDAFQRHLNGCEGVDEVVELITDDETTSESEVRVSYLNIYNPVFDELVYPPQSACLNQRFPNDCGDTRVNFAYQVPGPNPHGAIRMDSVVIEATYAHVTRRSRGPKQK